MTFRRLAVLRRAAFRLSTLALLPVAFACRNTTQITAQYPVANDTLVVYPISEALPGYPTALNTVNRTTVPISGTASFDVGFDLDQSSSHVVVYPVRTLVSSLTGAPTVGLMTTAVDYDSLTRAPDGYYRPDTAMTIAPHQTLVILSNRSSPLDYTCYYFATPRVYAKMVVDSIGAANHVIYFRQTVDPNCGFRSFSLGYPTN